MVVHHLLAMMRCGSAPQLHAHREKSEPYRAAHHALNRLHDPAAAAQGAQRAVAGVGPQREFGLALVLVGELDFLIHQRLVPVPPKQQAVKGRVDDGVVGSDVSRASFSRSTSCGLRKSRTIR